MQKVDGSSPSGPTMTKFAKACSTRGCSFIALHKDKCKFCHESMWHQLAVESREIAAMIKARIKERGALIRRLEAFLDKPEQPKGNS